MAHKTSANANIYDVTPSLAEQWLKRNKNNRQLSDRRIRQYVDDMLAGKWEQNGESIKFDDKGNLLDGQHRLTAVTISKKTVKMLVIEGLAQDVFSTIDIGKNRNAADVLHIGGHKHAARAAAAIRVVRQYERLASGDSHEVTRLVAEVRPNEVCEALAEHPNLIKAITEAGNAKTTKVMARALFDALFYLLRQKDKVMAKEFMFALRDGNNIQEYPAGLNLRERLINNSMERGSLTPANIAAMVIKVWNAARKGKPLQRATWNPGAESFPIIQ